MSRVYKSDANNLGEGFSVYVTEICGGGDSINTPSSNDSNPWFHIITFRGADGDYATQLALGMTIDGVWYRRCNGAIWGEWRKVWEKDIPKTSITWTTAGVSLTPGSETFSWYMVKNGWCFFQLTCTLAAVGAWYNLDVYLPKPMCGNYAYFRMNYGCVRINASGQMRIALESDNTNKVLQLCGSYPIL